VGGPEGHKHNYRLHATLCHFEGYGNLCYMLNMYKFKNIIKILIYTINVSRETLERLYNV